MTQRVTGTPTQKRSRTHGPSTSTPRTPDAKISPPDSPRAYITRPALESRLDEAFDHRLTVVAAGPGFGKSTLVAAWARRQGAAWYSVDSADSSLVLFARGLTSALRVQIPDLHAEGVSAAGWGREELAQAESLAWLVIEALEDDLQSDLALVVDDAHELVRASPSARLLETLCRVAPRRLHLVLSSRDPSPPFAVTRMSGRGDLLLIEAPSLAFTRDEVAEVLESGLGARSIPVARQLHELTGGWPAAVRIAVEALRGSGAVRGDAIEGLQERGSAVFAYLAEDVFAHQGADIEQFLRRVTLFERFTADLCTAIGVTDVKAVVTRLERSGLLVRAPGPDGWCKLHALVRRFAAERWPLDDAEFRELHRSAATWFEAREAWQEALRSWQAAGEWDAVSTLLSKCGPQLVEEGSTDLLLDAVEKLPDRLRGSDVLELAGEALHRRGDWQGALSYYTVAASSKEALPAGLARRLARLHFLREEFDEAFRIYERAEGSEGEAAEKAALDASRAMLHFRRGETEACRRAAVGSLEVATFCGDPSALAEAHRAMAALAALEGDRQEIDPHQLAALAAAERTGDSFLLMRIHLNRGVYLEEEGRYQEALRELEEAMNLADLLGPPDYLAGALCNRGDTRLALGRLEEAVTDYEQAKAIYEQMGSPTVVLPTRGLARVYRERGDLALARAAYEQARLVAQRAGDFVVTAACLGGLARISVSEEPDEAVVLAEQALDYAQGLARVAVLVDVGWVMLARGDDQQARSLASDGATAAREQHDRAGLAGALGLRALAEPDQSRRVALLEESVAIWRDLGNPLEEAKAELALTLTRDGRGAQANARRLERHLHRLGIRVQSAAEAAGVLMQIVVGAEPAIAIRSLGGFRLLRDGEIVPTTAWQSKKARDALQILVAARGRPVTRDALMEALWPEEDPEKASNRLSVALSTVRTVLDPDHNFAPDHYVLANREAVALGPGCADLDVEIFLADAEVGLARRRAGASPEATELLEAAEDAYTGDFLEEVYEDWAVPLREEARAAYLAVARALAEDAAADGAFDSAVRYRLRVLERDPYDESSHLGLITTLRAAGRHGDARRAYGAYVARMEELGIEPVPL